MFRRGLAYLKTIDWAAIVGSALMLAFLLALTQYQPPKSQQADTAAESNRNENDAWWHYSGAWIAIFTIILTGSTAALWWVTRRTLAHAEESSERQLRAYVSGTPDHIFAFNEKTLVQIRFKIINHGQTPAYDLSSYARVDLWPYPLPPKWDFGDPTELAPTSISVVYPGVAKTSTVTAGRLFTDEEIASAVSGDKFRFYLSGVIAYLDGFKGKRRTRFCSSIAGGPNLDKVRHGVVLSEGGIYFEATTDHNDAT